MLLRGGCVPALAGLHAMKRISYMFKLQVYTSHCHTLRVTLCDVYYYFVLTLSVIILRNKPI